eukprot:524806_1
MFAYSLLIWLPMVNCHMKQHQLDIGYPFQYFIPSTLFDVEVDDASLKQRTKLIEIQWLSMYGGVTIDSWTSKHGSYESYTGIIMREKVAVALVYMTDYEYNVTFNELVHSLNILNCLWWSQETYLYVWNNDAKLVSCDSVINATEWTFCTNPMNKTIERHINCGMYLDRNHWEIKLWNKCEQIGVGNSNNKEDIYKMISNCTEQITFDEHNGERSYDKWFIVAVTFIALFAGALCCISYLVFIKVTNRYGDHQPLSVPNTL